MNPINQNWRRFSDEHDVPYEIVESIVNISNQIGEFNEHVANGDDHPCNRVKSDKARNSEFWRRDANLYEQCLWEIVRQYGFTAIVYTGLGPTLKRGLSFIEIPYEQKRGDS